MPPPVAARPFREVYVVQLHVISLTKRARYLTCGLGGGLAAAAVAISPGVAQAASACQVSYSVSNDWGSGFTTTITIPNLGRP